MLFEYILLLMAIINSGLHKEILIKICQCIVQSRVDVDKNQISIFNHFLTQICSQKHLINKMSVQSVLNSLIIKQKSQARQKLSNLGSGCKVAINFFLHQSQQEKNIYVESWLIEVQQKSQSNASFEQSALVIIQIMKELLYLLVNQPLYRKYVRDTKIKQKFKINYNIQIKYLQPPTSQVLLTNCHIYNKQRVYSNQKVLLSLLTLKDIQIQNLYANPGSWSLQKFSKTKVQKAQNKNITTQHKIQLGLKKYSMKEISQKQRNEEFQYLHITKERKLSLFQIYDDNLECFLVSSNQSSFSSSPKNSIKQICFSAPEPKENQDQFEMLEYSKDDHFLKDNQKLFKMMSQQQKKSIHNFN